jgi:hypothetical protein
LEIKRNKEKLTGKLESLLTMYKMHQSTGEKLKKSHETCETKKKGTQHRAANTGVLKESWKAK